MNPTFGNQQPRVVYEQPVPQQTVQYNTVPQQPGNNYMFDMDAETYNILTNTPEIYRNFIINYGIKLASESPLFHQYISINKTEVNEKISLPEKNINTNKSQNQPSTSSQPLPAAAGGFSAW